MLSIIAMPQSIHSDLFMRTRLSLLCRSGMTSTVTVPATATA